MKRGGYRWAALVCAAALLTGCAGGNYPPEEPEDATERGTEVQTVELVPALADAQTTAPVKTAAVPKGDGAMTYAAGVTLTRAQEELLLDYMHLYYTSLAELSVQDISHLFAEDSGEQVESNMDTWEIDVEVRKMSRADLALTGYSFLMECTSAGINGDGYLSVRVSESSVQNFAAFPGIDSETMNIGHSFTLEQTGDGWRIRRHSQFSGANMVLMGRRFGSSSSSYTPMTKERFLTQARKDAAGRSTQGTEPGPVSAANPYNREAAVAYARAWVGERNPQWRSYDRMGGNCQNFISQAVHAGGVPMDYTAPGQWKWYGDTPNTSATASGRAPAWTGVGDFLTYVESNQGYGMVARADLPFYSGEPGDVIQLGTADGYRHTVIITEVVTDSRGNVVDYLVCSNTADLRNYPVSAYHYTNQMLIKIYGWNNG